MKKIDICFIELVLNEVKTNYKICLEKHEDWNYNEFDFTDFMSK